MSLVPRAMGQPSLTGGALACRVRSSTLRPAYFIGQSAPRFSVGVWPLSRHSIDVMRLEPNGALGLHASVFAVCSPGSLPGPDDPEVP